MVIKVTKTKRTALEKFQRNPTPSERENYVSVHCGRECAECKRLNINGGDCYGPKIKNPCLGFIAIHKSVV